MLIAWMLYALAVSAIVAGAAIALDQIAEVWRARRRSIWLAALIASAALPTYVLLFPRTAPHAAPVRVTARGGIQRQAFTFDDHAAPTVTPWTTKLRRAADATVKSPTLNRYAAAAWLMLTLCLVGGFGAGALKLRRLRAGWRAVRLDGRDVLISDDVGPAVVGMARPRVVLPSWALTLDDDARELMLDHEAEHLRSGDPATLCMAALIAAALPWNPFVWWIVRRLRLALEIDCDARVLARHARPREYGLLLLTVGARTNGALQFTASLAEPRLFLERRIIAMTTNRHARPVVASLPFIGIVVLAAAAAAQTPRPAAPARVAQTVSAASATPATPAAATPATGALPASTSSPVVARVAPMSQAMPAIAATAPSLALESRTVTPAMPVVVASAESPITQPAQPIAPAAAAIRHTVWEIPVDTLREWIRVHHPSVLTGDPSINYIYIVVDLHDRFIASLADSVFGPTPIVSAPTTARVQTARGDTVIVRRPFEVSPPNGNEKPIYIIDGVRVSSTDGLNPAAINTVEVLKGAAAVQQYGTDAVNGVIAIETRSKAQLRRLGVDQTEIKNMDLIRVGPGSIGPNALNLMIVKVARNGG
ncbi:MAG TPA: M56 family metallopeptidase [Gemmatimonadaceae bacterium]|nr:M56 family metallopeptidase [Gemmatimonadaceae bacterium]